MDFVVSPLPADWLSHVRRTGTDDSGRCYDTFTAPDDGALLRCCLRDAHAGERLALVAYRPCGTAGAYREIGPIFIHADPCDGYADPTTYPPGFRARPQVLRAYDRSGRITDALLVEGAEAESGIAKLLSQPEVTTIHSRNVLYGCYMFTINRP